MFGPSRQEQCCAGTGHCLDWKHTAGQGYCVAVSRVAHTSLLHGRARWNVRACLFSLSAARITASCRQSGGPVHYAEAARLWTRIYAPHALARLRHLEVLLANGCGEGEGPQ